MLPLLDRNDATVVDGLNERAVVNFFGCIVYFCAVDSGGVLVRSVEGKRFSIDGFVGEHLVFDYSLSRHDLFLEGLKASSLFFGHDL